jgi:WD40 repeat protein
MQQETTLRGHKGSISCLQVSVDGGMLLSASEDKTVRVWDVTSGKPTKCLAGCFQSDIETVRFGAAKGVVYVACTNSIAAFDIGKEGVILKEANTQVGMTEGGDEVSTMALNAKGDLLAVAMDSGVINLLPVKLNGVFCENSGTTRYKRLTRQHTNIVNTIVFKRNNPKELLSGGFDYTACVWETDRGKPKATTSFTALPAGDGEPSVGGSETASMPLQMVNPPFVMAMEYVLGGRCIVAALGDGTVSTVPLVPKCCGWLW